MDARRLGACVTFLACLACLLIPLPDANAATVPAGFTDKFIGFVNYGTGLAPTPDGRILITQQTGTVLVYENDKIQTTPAIDLGSRVCTNIERGLVGVAVDPDFPSNHYVYLFYTYNRGNGSCGTDPADPASQPVNRVSRFVLGDDDLIDPASEKVLLDNLITPTGNHVSGDLNFGKDGYLYVSLGDGFCDYNNDSTCGPYNDASRDHHVLLGKILRITSEGDIPEDNPFLGENTARCGLTGRTSPGSWCQEIYAWGLRNPFRFNMDPNADSTRFFINDTGQDNWEEVNLGQPGADYGWNVREGHCAVRSSVDCGPQPAGMTNPLYDYDHSAGCTAITGGSFIPDGLWPSQYDDGYLFEDFICGKIFLLVPDGGGAYVASEFATDLGYPVDMAFGPNGSSQALYYLQNQLPSLRRISFTGAANRSPAANGAASPTSGPLPLTVNFDGSQSTDPDNDPLTFDWDFGDGSTHSDQATVAHEYQTSGTYAAKLTVTDGRGGQDTTTIRIDPGNDPPTPSISSPSPGQEFAVGQPITLSGSASDPEDGTIPGSQLSWRVVKHHATHTHPFLPPTFGDGVTITGPAPEDFTATTNSYLEVFLTATDSQGVSTTVSRDIRPHLVNVGVASQPADLAVALNGNPAPSPVTSWEGWKLQVDTPSPQFDSEGKGETFVSWSDEGARSHTITTPSTDTTYTATFTRNYARPRGADLGGIPLVPAYRRCTNADLTHGSPLAFGSCSSPALMSNTLTMGTPDANGLKAQSVGFAHFRAVVGSSSTAPDEADVKISVSISDVFDRSAGMSDYTGDLQLKTGLRMTDHLTGDPATDTGTVRDIFFNARVACAPTPDPSGSTCQTQTTADALIPDTVVEGKRSIWEVRSVQVFDGGSDGSISTPGNTLFVTQGLFVP